MARAMAPGGRLSSSQIAVDDQWAAAFMKRLRGFGWIEGHRRDRISLAIAGRKCRHLVSKSSVERRRSCAYLKRALGVVLLYFRRRLAPTGQRLPQTRASDYVNPIPSSRG